jgi:mannitol 2-dehydrogenase
MTELRPGTLGLLDPRVGVPRYDRAALTPGIAHIGVGSFHRSHQAMYLDRLAGLGHAGGWGIFGLGIRSENLAMRDALAAQDCLYTLVLRHGDGTWQPQVIGTLTGYLLGYGNPAATVRALADPRIRIVSLTITEGGYAVDPVTGQFDPAVVAADLRPGAAPSTAFALVAAALSQRRAAGGKPFTIMSCDNVQGNGHVARDSFIGFARLADPELADWMAEHVRFPNSMVDRITPRTTEDDRAELARRFDVQDRWPVVCEPFTQWVLEDDFADGRPPLEEVGVQLVADVEPYELMKLRLLNASHQAIAYPAFLTGHRLVHDAAADPLFARFLLDYMRTEAIPTLRPVPGIDLSGYCDQLIERFANPEVGDTLARLATNGSDMIPKFLLPVLRANLAGGAPITRSVAVLAFWARYVQGTDEHGQSYLINDTRADALQAAAARQPPTAFLTDNRALFGAEIVDAERVLTLFADLTNSIQRRGVRATLADLDNFEA